MRYALLFTSLFLCSAVRAQSFFLNLDLGLANYDGELQSKRNTFNQSQPGGGVGLGYEFSPHFNLSTGFLLTGISGNDQYSSNPQTQARNLNFSSNLFEWNLRAEYVLYDLQDRSVSPYFFAGLSVFHFNPYTIDPSGQKVFLKPLSTEGEGLPEYPTRKPYSLTQPAIPFGAGIRLALSENIRVGLELGIRKTFTGYLDDVSATYVDKNVLLAEKGPEAVTLAYRSNELPGHSDRQYPAVGFHRGTGGDDWYYFTAIRIGIRLDGGDYTTNRYLRCPRF